MRYNWPMSAHASQAFSIAHCTDSEDLPFQAHIYVYLMITVYNESLICDCDGAEILRPQHFVVVCEHTSIHDDILSNIPARGNICNNI